jgi:hypothetical protein
MVPSKKGYDVLSFVLISVEKMVEALIWAGTYRGTAN